MTDEAVAAPVSAECGRETLLAHPTRSRARAALRCRANWYQLVRFGAVGASGYVVNLAVFALTSNAAGAHYQVAAAVAFAVALANNFAWNRQWTFKARDGHAGFQAARFFVVSITAFGVSLVVLTLLVESLQLAKLPAQAIAIATATPLNFVGNKLWSFRT